MVIDCVPIADIEFDVFCRHEIVPILMALQHLYVNRRDLVFEIVELIAKEIAENKDKKRGCKGLTYWEIFVLAALRLGCNTNFDQLSDLATNHQKIRQMMGLGKDDQKRFPKSTVNDNLISLSVITLKAISDLVVDEGHRFHPTAVEKVRGDSYVLQKNIHYPTDANLIVDGIRKVVRTSHAIAHLYDDTVWRQHKYLCDKAKQIKRDIEKLSRSRKVDKDEKIKALYKELIDFSQSMINRSLETINQFDTSKETFDFFILKRGEQLVEECKYYIFLTEYMGELARRRIIDGEKIPHNAKIFSLFEPDTELINRGKKPNPIEFGHRVLILQDSAGFIIYAGVMGRGITDEKIIVDVMQNLQKRFNNRIQSASFDKGFWTPNNLKELSEIIPLPVLPKKGKRSKNDAEREGAKEFGKARKWHSGIESAIHALGAGNGLIVCRDKGPVGFRRYLAYGVLGRNLHTLGMILLEKERERQREERLLALCA